MSQRKSPSLQHAINFILDGIAHHTFEQYQMLPAIPRLAELARVSPVTMHKAVGELKKRGILSGAFGQRARVQCQAPLVAPDQKHIHDTPSMSLTTPSTAQKVAERIEKDILNGLYPPNRPLGSYKELANRYTCCYRTLKSALDLLVERNVISSINKHFYIAAPTPVPQRSRIVLLGCMDEEGNLIRGVGGEDFMQCVEFECARSGLRLAVRMYHPKDTTILFRKLPSRSPCDLDDDESVLGYIFISVWEEDPWKQVVSILARKKKPVAIFTYRKNMSLPDSPVQRSLFKKFLIGGTNTPGFVVGQYLLGLGHRSIAYFSPFHNASWSPERLAGLREAFRSMGLESKVVALTLNRFSRTAEFYQSAQQHLSLTPVLDNYHQWLASIPASFRHHIQPVFENSLTWAYLSGEVYRQLEPLFRKALAMKNITAWVAANDRVAAMMLSFLSRQKIAVPDSISVVGYDNSSIALRNYLTSYEFNIQHLTSAIMSFILKKGYFARSRKETCIEIDGMLVERMTTARVV